MSIDQKARDIGSIKAPQGMFAVIAWDPSNPEKSTPTIIETQTTGRDAVYKSERYASWYASVRNDQWYKEMKRKQKLGQQVIGELEYFVIDDQGTRIN